VRVIAFGSAFEYARPQVSLDGRYVAFGKINYIDIVIVRTEPVSDYCNSRYVWKPNMDKRRKCNCSGSLYELWFMDNQHKRYYEKFQAIMIMQRIHDQMLRHRIVFSMTGNIYSINIDEVTSKRSYRM